MTCRILAASTTIGTICYACIFSPGVVLDGQVPPNPAELWANPCPTQVKTGSKWCHDAGSLLSVVTPLAAPPGSSVISPLSSLMAYAPSRIGLSDMQVGVLSAAPCCTATSSCLYAAAAVDWACADDMPCHMHAHRHAYARTTARLHPVYLPYSGWQVGSHGIPSTYLVAKSHLENCTCARRRSLSHTYPHTYAHTHTHTHTHKHRQTGMGVKGRACRAHAPQNAAALHYLISKMGQLFNEWPLAD